MSPALGWALAAKPVEKLPGCLLVYREPDGVGCPGHSTSGLWLDVMVLHNFVLGNVVCKGMVTNIHFFHSRWLTQINPADIETGRTVFTSWWLPAACLNRVDDSQWCS